VAVIEKDRNGEIEHVVDPGPIARWKKARSGDDLIPGILINIYKYQ